MNSKNKQLTKSETLIAYLYAIVAVIQFHSYFLWEIFFGELVQRGET